MHATDGIAELGGVTVLGEEVPPVGGPASIASLPREPSQNRDAKEDDDYLRPDPNRQQPAAH